jgi:hypothetical protein
MHRFSPMGGLEEAATPEVPGKMVRCRQARRRRHPSLQVAGGEVQRSMLVLDRCQTVRNARRGGIAHHQRKTEAGALMIAIKYQSG